MVAEACGGAAREGQWRGSLGRTLSAAAVACAAPNKHMERFSPAPSPPSSSLELRYAAWPARRWIMEGVVGVVLVQSGCFKPLIWAALNPGRFGLICGSWEMEQYLMGGYDRSSQRRSGWAGWKCHCC
jgi:hypothetical protein